MKILSGSEFIGRKPHLFALQNSRMSKSTSDLTAQSQAGRNYGVKSAGKRSQTKMMLQILWR